MFQKKKIKELEKRIEFLEKFACEDYPEYLEAMKDAVQSLSIQIKILRDDAIIIKKDKFYH